LAKAMAQIIEFRQYSGDPRARRVLGEFAQRLGYELGAEARIRDLPDDLLLALAEGATDDQGLIEGLIVWMWTGTPGDIRSLPPGMRIRAVDLSLFLIDQFRFECMARLGWIDPSPARDVPVVCIILGDAQTRRPLRQTPRLRDDHPHGHRFRAMMEVEKETFVRKQIPAALEQFRRRAIRHR
jgi:hypothetical protein